MDPGLHSPLIDFFLRGDVARDVRLQAAQGVMAPRALDQLTLLMMLTSDADLEIRDAAEATLTAIPVEHLSAFIARSDVPSELRDFFVKRGVAVADSAAADADTPLVDRDDTDYGKDDAEQTESMSLYTRLAAMTVPQKVKAAMKGTREMRGVLIRDPNKLVALSVLSSPKVTEMEVEGFARMGSVNEDVLRVIARTRQWIKKYTIVLALVKNAKTPLAVSLNLLGRLHEADVRRLSSDRNIPEPLRIAARKRIVIG